jgi:hypothetical protein
MSDGGFLVKFDGALQPKYRVNRLTLIYPKLRRALIRPTASAAPVFASAKSH